MATVFEDAFTDVQSRMISACLELLEVVDKTPDTIYVYAFQNEVQDFFNVAFKKDSQIYWQNDWFSDEQIDDLFDCGVEDIETLIETCEEYDRRCPNELKLTYDVAAGSLDAAYGYEDFVSEGDGDIVDAFESWIEELRD